MKTVTASAERVVGAPADIVYRCLADMSERQKFLPPAFQHFTVESGGYGAGTVLTYTFGAARQSRAYRMAVAEPEPGRVLTESDTGSSLVITYTVAPQPTGTGVRISATWKGARGIRGHYERKYAPKAVQGIYENVLLKLDEHVRALTGGGPGVA